ncbi:hypothetical protein SRABI128_02350 [Microbacterium sp. Bi128]|nr:hypothetical protein SRABI128_02350 [Microbacterium sp. Bi128]
MNSNAPVWSAFTALGFFALTVDYDPRILLRTLLTISRVA